MALLLNHVYLVGLVIPSVLNDASPKTPAILGPLQTMDVGASSNPKQVRRHFCVILEFDPVTRIGVMLLGTSRPRQPHRFVPCQGTLRLQHQPRHEVSLSPPGGLRSTGYFNFSHALRATIIVQGDASLVVFPPQAFLTETYSDGTNIDVFLIPSEVEALKAFHSKYWEGQRYDRDGYPILGGAGGPGGSGGGGAVGGSGAGGAAGGSGDEGALGGAGGPGGSGGGGAARGSGGGGAVGSSGGGDEGAGGGGSAPYFRPIRADGTISLPHPPTGERGSGAERLARALLEEDERMAQLDLFAGAGEHFNLGVPQVFAFVEPLTMKALELVDSL